MRHAYLREVDQAKLSRVTFIVAVPSTVSTMSSLANARTAFIEACHPQDFNCIYVVTFSTKTNHPPR